MLAVSFNINSLRIRLHQLQRIIDKYQPDFIGLQETKVNDPDFPEQAIIDMGYHVHYHGQKTHYGVALLSKHPRSEEHTSELQSRGHLVCRPLLEKKQSSDITTWRYK